MAGDRFDEVAALYLPMPSADSMDDDDVNDEALAEARWQVEEEREQLAAEHRLADQERDLDSPESDVVLDAVVQARQEMLHAEQRLRHLLAYAREFIEPRPYSLQSLAEAAGMSISGIRTAYDDDEIKFVSRQVGRKPRRRPS